MATIIPPLMRHVIVDWPVQRCLEIWETFRKDRLLWRRMVKVVFASSVANAIMLIPRVEAAVGAAAYLGGIATAFGHPGRRLGQMVEALVLVIFGTMLGVGWSILGLYLASLIIDTNESAAYTIRGIFLAVALFLHGFFRSFSPRIFLGTVLFIIVSVVNLVSTARHVTALNVTNIVYPIFIAIGLLLLVNVCIFPEFSSSYLGGTVTSSLHEVSSALKAAGEYFTNIAEPNAENTKKEGDEKTEASTGHSISVITALKAKIRAKVTSCKATQNECNFELAYSVLRPRSLKPISQTAMSRMSMSVTAIIGACESKFALLGDETSLPVEPVSSSTIKEEDEENSDTESSDDRFEADLELIKPKREIESGDPELLRHFIKQITQPYQELQAYIDRSVAVINACVSHTYHVPEMPDGTKTPAGISIEEVDMQAETMRNAIDTFDSKIQAALDAHGMWKKVREHWPDVMPREEIFLISLFYLNIRQAAFQVATMLEASRNLLDSSRKRKGRRRLYAPRISWRKWLQTGGGEDQQPQETVNPNSMQPITRQASQQGEPDTDESDDDEEATLSGRPGNDLEAHTKFRAPRRIRRAKSLANNRSQRKKITSRARSRVADGVEKVQHSDQVQYALKVTIASFLVLWPALVAPWSTWFATQRGLWAALQLILITEPTVGNSVQTFILRAFGTTLGCLWGWAAYEAGNGNRVICGVMIAIGIVPAAYVILGSKYVKAGIVTIVSITVVALATEIQHATATATETFLRRFLAFTIGAAVALVVQVAFLPAKARTRMVESLVVCLRHVQDMQSSIAFGIERVSNADISNPKTMKRFERAVIKAKASLQAAEGYIPFCLKEPRLKGSFEGQLLVYKEIAFVLHQIIDRMENMFMLRSTYGSGPLQMYNTLITQYRRNLASSIIISLFAVREALITHQPLPQFMPSARLAQIRLINRVREAVRDDVRNRIDEGSDEALVTRRHAIRRNFLSWNAGQMSQAEIVEYIEELVDLTKLLVGANEFRTGLLFRPSLQEHLSMVTSLEEVPPVQADVVVSGSSARSPPLLPMDAPIGQGLRKRATSLIGGAGGPSGRRESKGAEDAELPYSLQRIQTKKLEAVLKKRQTFEAEKS